MVRFPRTSLLRINFPKGHRRPLWLPSVTNRLLLWLQDNRLSLLARRELRASLCYKIVRLQHLLNRVLRLRQALRLPRARQVHGLALFNANRLAWLCDLLRQGRTDSCHHRHCLSSSSSSNGNSLRHVNNSNRSSRGRSSSNNSSNNNSNSNSSPVYLKSFNRSSQPDSFKAINSQVGLNSLR